MEQNLPKNPWWSMWRHPRSTVSTIIHTNPRKRFVILSFISGIAMVLHTQQMLNFGTMIPLWMTLLIAIVLAIPFGAISIWIMTALVLFVGKIVKGHATFLEMRAAVSWSNVAGIGTIIIWAVLIGTFGSSLFTATFAGQTFDSTHTMIVILAFLAQFIFGVWGVVMLIQGIAAAQRFSGWRALVNLLLLLILVSILVYVGSWILMHYTHQANNVYVQ